jgi:indole-3-glycerol phosphate synthase
LANILKTIVAAKRTEMAAAKAALPLAELQAKLPDAPPLRDFFAALAADGALSGAGFQPAVC